MKELFEEILRELRESAVIRGAGDAEVYRQIQWFEDELAKM